MQDIKNQNLSENHRQHHADDPFSDQKIKKTSKGFCGFFILRERITLLIILAIVIMGSLAVFSIPREADPEVKIPYAVVSTIFPGASPVDVENLVTDKIEAKIEELDRVKLVTSGSSLGVSSIFVEFEAEADLDKSIQNLRDKVAEVTGLPDDANDPMVREIRMDDTPIINFSLAGNLPETELKKIGEDIQSELEKIPGVSEVSLIGAREREFQVIVNSGALSRLNIPLTAIAQAIAVSNTDTPLGNITINQSNYSIRAVAKIESLKDLKNIVVTTVNNSPILLQDIAQVKDSLADQTSISRLSVNGKPAISTVSLSVSKRTGGNILNIVDKAKEKIEKLQANKTIPPEITVNANNDYSQFIRNDLKTLGTSGIQSVIVIFIILFLALSFREALISLVAIPMTFLITIFIMDFLGYTLNSLALFTLVLSLGLLVDAFIIILEGIFHNMRLGYNSRDAALLSISHYKNPLLAGTFTTISAFAPMLLVSGIMGEYLKVLPITISIALGSSLFVSLAIVPAVGVIFLKRRKVNGNETKESVLEKYLTNYLTKIYTEKITKLLADKKKKIKFISAMLVLFIVSLGLLIGQIIPVKLFPEVDVDFGLIDIEMPIGTDLQATNELTKKVENYLYNRSDIKSFLTSVGNSSSFGFSNSQSSEHLASINLTYSDESNRNKKSYEINDEIREDLKNITKGKITITEISAGPPTGSPIEIRITGDDLKILDQLTQQTVDIVKSVDGVIDVQDSRTISPADLTFTLNKETLAKSNLSVSEVSGFLRTAIFGVEATEINIEGEDVDVIVKFGKQNIDSEEIKNLSIINSRGQSFKLSRLADFSLEPAYASIRHRDFQRTATVQANLKKGYTPSVVMPEIQKIIESEINIKGYDFNFGGEVEDIQQSFTELWNAMIVAVILIAFILILQFDSFRRPLIILMTIPLALIGVVTGMLIFRLPFSFSVFLGLISLAGIVVNDAIVLLDKTKRNIKENKMKPRSAVINAGQARLQPILLTSITTIAGVVPLAFADKFWLGLSISIIFGLAFATILQLFVIPIIFLKLEGKKILRKMNQ